METNKIYLGNALDVLRTMPNDSIDCCVTSPPYYALRDYGTVSQIGLEETPTKYVEKLTEVFMEVHRVLKPTGTLWVNIGDSYNGSGGNHKATHKNDTGFQGKNGYLCGGKGAKVPGLKSKDLIGIPWMLAFSLRDAGWYLRQDIIWHKPNPMPESVTDRCTKSHEYIFLLSKAEKYLYDAKAIREPCSQVTIEDFKRRKNLKNKGGKPGTFGAEARPDLYRSRADYIPKDFMRNKRDVWTINTGVFRGAHFAVFPEKLVVPCILAGCPEGGIVLDPFMGSGTTGLVANKLGRRYIGIELNHEYKEMAEKRIMEESSHVKIDFRKQPENNEPTQLTLF